jgi:hypothetical protein
MSVSVIERALRSMVTLDSSPTAGTSARMVAVPALATTTRFWYFAEGSRIS